VVFFSQLLESTARNGDDAYEEDGDDEEAEPGQNCESYLLIVAHIHTHLSLSLSLSLSLMVMMMIGTKPSNVKLRATPVAVKLMNVPTSVHDRCVLHDIFTEILILEQFRHDADACRLYDYGVDHQHYWITMRRYCGSLKEWRKRQVIDYYFFFFFFFGDIFFCVCFFFFFFFICSLVQSDSIVG
jgi:hypothetical protein